MRIVPLGQIASMRYGKLPPKEQLDSGYPIFTGYRVSGYSSSYLYKEPMLVVVARGVGGTGDVKISPPNSWITNLSIVLDVDQEQADKYFLCAYLSQQSLKERLDTGSAQAQITVNALEPFLVTIPDLPTQRRIASILSAYDDLIENNTRRIAILEEMARSIYEEWFVRFRFPGHEQVKMVESELGSIPDGWSEQPVGKLVAINAKSIRAGKAPEEILYIDIASVEPGAITQKQPYRFDEAPGRARRLVTHGDVLWSCVRPNRRSYALVLKPESTLIASTGFAVLTAQRVPYSYLYYAVTTESFVGYLTNHATGAAYPAVTASTFEAAPVMLPVRDVLDQFHTLVSPMLDLAESLRRKNANLRATRDLLLPKLISGELPAQAIENTPTVTLTIERELSPSDIENISRAFIELFDIYSVEERVQSLPEGFIGFLTKEEIRTNVKLAVECIRKDARVTVLVLTPLLANLSQGVLGNLLTDLLKESTPGKQNASHVADRRVSKGVIKYPSKQGAVCGQLRAEQLEAVLKIANNVSATIDCNETGYSIRLGPPS